MSSPAKWKMFATEVVLGVVLAAVLGIPLDSGAATRTEAAAMAREGIARVDSLLDADQAAAAVSEARRLHDQLGSDPLYGWQITGRLGLALLLAGDPQSALPLLEEVMRHNPNDHVAHRNFAVALLALGRKGRALSEFQIVVELAPGDYEARLEYGQVLAEFGDVKAACDQLEVARRLCPDCLDPDRAMAAALSGAGRYSDAIDPLRRLQERYPDPDTRLQLAQAFVGAGRDRDLLDFLTVEAPAGLSPREMKLVVEAEGRLGETAWSLGCLGAASGDGSVPGGLPDGLLTDHAFWGRISLNLLEAGRFAEGLSAADRAVEIDPRNVVYRNNRVVLLLELGREEEAAHEWEEVLKLDPSLKAKESE